MPAVQTTYSNFIGAAYLGMIANGEWATNIISRVVDPAATVAVGFGDAVLQGSSEQTVVSANGGTGVFRGIAIRDTTLPPGDDDRYPPTSTVGVMTCGVVWVNAGVAVNPGQPSMSPVPVSSPMWRPATRPCPMPSGRAPRRAPPWPSCG